jgi:hypothetical protein
MSQSLSPLASSVKSVGADEAAVVNLQGHDQKKAKVVGAERYIEQYGCKKEHTSAYNKHTFWVHYA